MSAARAWCLVSNLCVKAAIIYLSVCLCLYLSLVLFVLQPLLGAAIVYISSPSRPKLPSTPSPFARRLELPFRTLYYQGMYFLVERRNDATM